MSSTTTPDPQTAVIVVTDDSDEPCLSAALAMAADASRRSGKPVIFYDRSGETWVDTPHPVGPLEADDERIVERPHLAKQLAVAAEVGAHPQAWLATLPSIGNITIAVAETGADVIIVPTVLEGRMADKSTAGADLPETVAAHFLQDPADPVVVAVDEQGAARVIETVSR